jgi:hypothetical protein
MKPQLDRIKTEIEKYLGESGIEIFYGQSRTFESVPPVRWDGDRYPDFRLFVKAAQAAGAKMLVYHERKFSAEQLDDALEELSSCDMPRDEHKSMERRLEKMRAYEGLVCAIELSFDHEGRVFLFDLRTDWFEELTDILEELELMGGDLDDDDPSMGGYFSKN